MEAQLLNQTAANIKSRWTSGLCECSHDTESCMDVCCCSCFANARQYDAVEGKPNSMNIIIAAVNLLIGSIMCFNCAVRHNMVARFNLDESQTKTFCLGCCCSSCAMCQQHRELTARGLWPGGTICATPPAGYAPVPAPPMGYSSSPLPGVHGAVFNQIQQHEHTPKQQPAPSPYYSTATNTDDVAKQ